MIFLLNLSFELKVMFEMVIIDVTLGGFDYRYTVQFALNMADTC